jgi:hypothetical protein
MMRRQARERREYIFRKAEEQQQRAVHSKKALLKSAIEQGKSCYDMSSPAHTTHDTHSHAHVHT